jgi:hypothetical protein
MAGTGAREVWMQPTAAAKAAGVSARSVFRWAARAKVPVRVEGKTRLVEVNALRAYAARPWRATVAQGTATESPAASSPSPEAFAELVHRVERLERTLRLPPDTGCAGGGTGGAGAHALPDLVRGPA